MPSEADALVAEGDEESLRRALELEPGRADAAVPLARPAAPPRRVRRGAAVLDNVSGSFAADGLAARMRLEQADDVDLDEAFKALDDGDTERAIDLLIEALSSADGHKDDVRRVVVGAWTSSASTTRSRATRAAGWPPLCTSRGLGVA